MLDLSKGQAEVDTDISGSNISVEMLATQRKQLAELTMIRKGIEILIGRLLISDYESGSSNSVFVA